MRGQRSEVRGQRSEVVYNVDHGVHQEDEVQEAGS